MVHIDINLTVNVLPILSLDTLQIVGCAYDIYAVLV